MLPSKGDKTQSYLEPATLGFVVLLLLLSIMKLPSLSFGYEANDTITINVTVAQVAMVTIDPSSLSWSNVEPGSVGDEDYEDHGYDGIWIENIGSVNITYVWFNASYPPSSPFGTGDPQAYDAGNFVVLTPNESTTPYHFVNRVEYNDLYRTGTMYVFPAGTPSFFGRFRNASYEYFIELDATNYGNCSSGSLYISDTPKTKENSGDIYLSDNTPVTVNPVSYNGKTWGVAEVDIDTQKYCVIFDSGCNYAIFNRWNADLPGVNSTYCPNVSGYMKDDSTQPIVPGDVFKVNIRVYVPYGVPYGTVKTGTLTVFVKA